MNKLITLLVIIASCFTLYFLNSHMSEKSAEHERSSLTDHYKYTEQVKLVEQKVSVLEQQILELEKSVGSIRKYSILEADKLPEVFFHRIKASRLSILNQENPTDLDASVGHALNTILLYQQLLGDKNNITPEEIQRVRLISYREQDVAWSGVQKKRQELLGKQQNEWEKISLTTWETLPSTVVAQYRKDGWIKYN